MAAANACEPSHFMRDGEFKRWRNHQRVYVRRLKKKETQSLRTSDSAHMLTATFRWFRFNIIPL